MKWITKLFNCTGGYKLVKKKNNEKEIIKSEYDLLGLIIVFLTALFWIFIVPNIFNIESSLSNMGTWIIGSIMGLYSLYYFGDLFK